MLPVVVCGTLLRQYVICFFVAAPCDVTILQTDQAEDETGLNWVTAPSCVGATCTVQSGSSITMSDTDGACGAPSPGFSFYTNGQCLFLRDQGFTGQDVVLASSAEVVYTCSNGNLQATVQLVDITTGSTPYTFYQVSNIACDDTC